MAIRLVVLIEAAPGKREEFITSFASLCRDVREEPGCQQFETYQDIENQDRFVMLERWADQEKFAIHGERHEEQWLKMIEELMARPPEAEQYAD